VTQFAVFRSSGRNPDIPFLVQIQSNRLAGSADRVVMPLAVVGYGAPADHPLTPHLRVLGVAVFANPLNLATVRASTLRERVCVLEEREQDRIVRAVDEMISRA
jgi:toxin CcdB